MTVTKKQAPYQHGDGSACWTKNCSRNNDKIEIATNRIQDIFNQAPAPIQPEFVSWEEGYYNSCVKALEESGFRIDDDSDYAPNSKYPTYVRVKADSEYTILITEHRSPYKAEKKFFITWLIDTTTGDSRGMIEFSTGGDELPTLCDIEIRKEYRGNALGKKFINFLNDRLSVPLHTTGHYTPEGWRSLGDFLPLNEMGQYEKKEYERSIKLFGRKKTRHNPIGVGFNSMNFVDNWDKLYKA